MARIGITGHSTLTAGSAPLVAEGIREALAGHENLIGVTCLARGADRLFAKVTLDLGGTIEVVLPAADYRERKVAPAERPEFDILLKKADTIHTMAFTTSSREAYMAASEHLMSTVDELVAVWDGALSSGFGGTADVVAAARATGLPVTVVWPAGCTRD